MKAYWVPAATDAGIGNTKEAKLLPGEPTLAMATGVEVAKTVLVGVPPSTVRTSTVRFPAGGLPDLTKFRSIWSMTPVRPAVKV